MGCDRAAPELGTAGELLCQWNESDRTQEGLFPIKRIHYYLINIPSGTGRVLQCEICDKGLSIISHIHDIFIQNPREGVHNKTIDMKLEGTTGMLFESLTLANFAVCGAHVSNADADNIQLREGPQVEKGRTLSKPK